MSFRETIDRVIDLARQVKDYYNAELPKYHPRYPFIDPAAVGPPRPRAQDNLKELIEALPPRSIYALMTIMYLGRGDFRINGLTRMYEHALTDMCDQMQRTFPQTDRAVAQIMSKGPLGEYLADGLRELTDLGVDVESLPFQQIHS